MQFFMSKDKIVGLNFFAFLASNCYQIGSIKQMDTSTHANACQDHANSMCIHRRVCCTLKMLLIWSKVLILRMSLGRNSWRRKAAGFLGICTRINWLLEKIAKRHYRRCWVIRDFGFCLYWRKSGMRHFFILSETFFLLCTWYFIFWTLLSGTGGLSRYTN